MTLAEFNPTAEVTHTVHVTQSLSNYDIIIGQDLLHELEIDIKFSTKSMCWNDVEVDMKPPTCTKEDSFHVEEELFVNNETDRIAKILDAKYQPADLTELTANISNLMVKQQKQLFLKCFSLSTSSDNNIIITITTISIIISTWCANIRCIRYY